jgi:1,2-diacylglycerol 3-alpha-glucosyltransferase
VVGQRTEPVQLLRVGFFTEVYRPVVNGVVASVDALAQGLRDRGHEVYCFTPWVPGYEESDGPVFRMPSLPLPARTPYRLTLPLVSRRNLNRVIKRLSVIHVHSPFVTGWMGLRYARRYGMPLVYTYHTLLEEYAHYVPFDTAATRYAASQLTRGFANLADAVVVPTGAMAAHLRDVGVTVPVHVVLTGIDLARFGAGRRDAALRERIGGGSGRLLLVVSRLAQEKNVHVLIQALARSGQSDLRLVVAGDGPERPSLEALSRKLDVADRTVFLGEVPHSQLPDLYASADAFVFASTTETQGLVQAEALAAGALVIAADAPTNRDVLGGAGRLVPSEPEAFARAFAAVPLEPDPAERDRARQAAERFSIANQAERTIDIYRALVPVPSDEGVTNDEGTTEGVAAPPERG